MHHNENHRIRLHRASSWLARSCACADEDLDGRFVFLWIALNAAYARAFGEDDSEREKLKQFLQLLVKVDAQRRLHALVMQRFTGAVRMLIDNQFVFQPFWTALRDHDASGQWEKAFAVARKEAVAAVLAGNTVRVYEVVFDRLYVLRNQLVHGGATCGSRVNREQLKQACALLAEIVPVMIGLMEENPEADWGEVMYPVVGNV